MTARLGFAPVVLCLGLCSGLTQAVRAQVAEFDSLPVAATVPVSNEAVLLASRAAEAAQRGDFRVAAQMLQQLRQLSDGLVAAPASRTFYPAAHEANRLLRQFPPAGVEQVRRLTDPEVRARLERALPTGDLTELQTLFETFPLSALRQEIGAALAWRLIDRGQLVEAVATLSAMSPDDTPQPSLRAARLMLLTALGSASAAQELADQPALGGEAAALVRAWAAERTAPQGQPLHPVFADDLTWRAALTDHAGDPVRSYLAATLRLRRLMLTSALVAGDMLIVRQQQRIRAFDELTLTEVWSADEITARLTEAFVGGGWHPPEPDREPLEPRLDEAFNHPMRHEMSAAGDLLYTIEQLPPPEQSRPRLRGWGGISEPRRNELIARALATGRVVWRSSLSDAGLAGAVFQAAPAVSGADLLVLAQRGEELRLLALDPQTGALRRDVMIVGPPTRFSELGGACQLILDETSILIVTGNGVIASLRRSDYSWNWATVYPSMLGRDLFRPFFREPSSEPGIGPPHLAGDLLIAAPSDAREVIALDRFDGRERWRTPRTEYACLVGAAGGAVIFAGAGVTALDIRDGRTILWKSLPYDVTGRPLIDGDAMHVQTSSGLVTLDVRSGKVRGDAALARLTRALVDEAAGQEVLIPSPMQLGDPLVGNLVRGADSLLLVTPRDLRRYADPQRLADSATRVRAERPQHSTLALSWSAALSGDWNAARKRLAALDSAAAELKGARNDLLSQLCLALADRAGSAAERLALLQQAADTLEDPAQRCAVTVALGDALIEAHRPREAVALWLHMLSDPDERSVVLSADAQLRTAGWRVAASRLNAMSEELTAADLGAVLSAQPAPSTLLLRRLFELDHPPEFRQELAERLLAATPNAEQALRYVAALPPRGELSATLLLDQWETHVSLGMRAAAAQDEAEWDRRGEPGDATASAPSGADVVRRVRRLREALGKLQRTLAPPLSAQPRVQWVAAEMAPVQDAASLAAEDETLMLISSAQAEPSLHLWHLARGVPLRTTEAVPMQNAELRARAIEQARRASISPVSEISAGWRMALRYEHRIVAPASGGLVCAGLGPERYGGRRLWEHVVSAWRESPGAFRNLAVGTPQGVAFCPRSDALRMLSWEDGTLLWERDFGGRTAQRVSAAGGQLIIVLNDSSVMSLRPATGELAARLTLAELGAIWLDVAGDAALLWSNRDLVGLDPTTFQQRWKIARVEFGTRHIEPQQGLVALRQRNRELWTIVDAASGAELVSDISLGLAEVTALQRYGDSILVAGLAGADAPQVIVASVRARVDGAESVSWRVALESSVSINRSQLAASSDFVPVLSASAGVDDRSQLRVVMLRKSDGQIAGTVEISPDAVPAWRAGPLNLDLLATSSRILIVGGDHVLALGGAVAPAP